MTIKPGTLAAIRASGDATAAMGLRKLRSRILE
jgi:hypothetical protein